MPSKDHQKKILKDRWKWEKEFDGLCQLVANTVGAAEKPEMQLDIQGKFYEILVDRTFSPNTPTWANAGRPWKGSLSACFVYNIDDTMEGILNASSWMGMIQKFGGGTGFDLSHLRARGTPIKSTHGKACGPIAVLKYLAATSQMVTQGGVRDGANMAVLSVYHKDVMDFITLKARESKYLLEIPREFAQTQVDSGKWSLTEAEEYIEYCRLQGLYQLFNVSVAVDQKFMEAVASYEHAQKNGEPDSVTKESWSYNEILPCGQPIWKVWDAIVTQAWSSGDPGLLFLDRAKEIAACHSPLPIWATNPCGEQYLPHNGSCNLGSIDLSKFVKPIGVLGMVYLKDQMQAIDWEKLRYVIRLAVRFLDNVVEINHHADKGVDEVNKQERRIGLGIMGWADMLFRLGIPYDSQEALEAAEIVGDFFQSNAHQASIDLAKEKGPFPLFSEVADRTLSNGVRPMPTEPRRNATVTTIAPTGTISLVAGCSSGIEPHFYLKYEHKGMKDQGGLGIMWASESLENAYNGTNRTIVQSRYLPGFTGISPEAALEEFEKEIRSERGWKPANEIGIDWHIAHQAAWQKNIDNSISKTLNLPNDVPKDAVDFAYLRAWQEGCKGSTVYRDGCKPFQVLNAPQKGKEAPREVSSVILEVAPPQKSKRPKWVASETARIETSEGDLYVTVTHDDRGMPFEVFAQVGKGGTTTAASCEALNRTISIGLRFGVHPFEYIRQLRGIKSTQFGFGPNAVFSVPDGIGQVLEEYMVRTFGDDWGAEFGWASQSKEGKQEEVEIEKPLVRAAVGLEACSKCGAGKIHSEGCHGGMCPVCGDSKCS